MVEIILKNIDNGGICKDLLEDNIFPENKKLHTSGCIFYNIYDVHRTVPRVRNPRPQRRSSARRRRTLICIQGWIIWNCHIYIYILPTTIYNMFYWSRFLEQYQKELNQLSGKAQEQFRGEEVMPGNFILDKITGFDTAQFFTYLSSSERLHFQATCFQIRTWFEIKFPDVIMEHGGPVVEADLEQALFYRLWGPYHGYWDATHVSHMEKTERPHRYHSIIKATLCPRRSCHVRYFQALCLNDWKVGPPTVPFF